MCNKDLQAVDDLPAARFLKHARARQAVPAYLGSQTHSRTIGFSLNI
jgi:hypothetical protein